MAKKLPKKEKAAESLEERYDNRPTLYFGEDQLKFKEDPELKSKIELDVTVEVVGVSVGEYGENKGKKEYRFRIDSVKPS
jgi:hypothetical protein